MSYPQLLSPEEKLVDAKARLGIRDVVVLCGSMRFAAEMAEAAVVESVAGALVLKPDCNMKIPHPLWADPVEAEALKVRLDDLHRQKIRLADRVIVVGDYVGDSTRGEIAYARELGKPVAFTHPQVDPAAEAESYGPEVVAYRNPDRPGVLLCREHGDGWAWLTPLTANDLPDGGLCTYGDPADPDDACGIDVLIPQATA